MMEAVSFLLDECVPEYLQDEIIRLEPSIDVLQVGQDLAPPKGTLDPDLLIFAAAHQMTFVSRDKKTLPGHLKDHFRAGRHTCGVCILIPGYAPVRYAEDLVLIWTCCKLDEMTDSVFYLPL